MRLVSVGSCTCSLGWAPPSREDAFRGGKLWRCPLAWGLEFGSPKHGGEFSCRVSKCLILVHVAFPRALHPVPSLKRSMPTQYHALRLCGSIRHGKRRRSPRKHRTARYEGV